MIDLRTKECKNCHKKTLSYPPSKEWSKWKDRTRLVCRSCKCKFKILNNKEKEGDA